MPDASINLATPYRTHTNGELRLPMPARRPASQAGSTGDVTMAS